MSVPTFSFSEMEYLSWFMFSATWLAATIVLIFLKKFLHSRVNLPPGPKPWPIIGNLNLISSLPHISLHNLSQKYGPIMQLRYGSFPVVVASSSEMAIQFLKIHDLNFASRPRSEAGKYTSYDHGDLVYAPYGPYLRHVRKICATELFSMSSLENYEHIRVEELRAFLSAVYGSSGKAITFKDHFSNLTLNNMARMILGNKYSGESESKEFRDTLEEWEVLNGVLNIGDLIPWINFLDLQGYVKRMKALRNKMDSFLERVVEEHVAKRDYNQSKDLLDVLLEVADDPNSDHKLSRNNVKGISLNLLAGGTETSSTTTEWAMAEVIKNPEILRKATEELDRVIGRDRWVTEEDIASLHYIKSIVLETLRMHPVAPMLVPHLARENCKIQGYDILEGTRVVVNIWSIGRDPTLWDAPNEFKPERFSGRDIDVKGQNFELLPFGSGRRMCPGYNLGLKFVESGLANLLHGFTWELPNQMKPEDMNMEEVFGLTVPMKVPLVVVPTPRLPSHLYSM